MSYLLNTNFKKDKFVFLGFMSIYGIGKQTSVLLCKKLGLSLNYKGQNLPKSKLNSFTQMIEYSRLVLDRSLKTQKIKIKENLVEIKSYKGF